MRANQHLAADRAIARKLQVRRSPLWDNVRKAFLKKHPNCVACGATSELNVHHIVPFHFVVFCGRPDLELDPRNLMTLCTGQDREHHLLLGHLDDYESYNPKVKQFVKTYFGKSNPEIRADAAWKRAAAAKHKHLDKMSATEIAAFKKMMDRKFKPKPSLAAQAAHARAIA